MRSVRALCPAGNTRTTIHQPPFPLTIVRGDGARLIDADGHEYIDFLGEYTAGLYGHSSAVIVDAIRSALADGFVLGAPNRYEGVLAKAICERFPSIELVRFCRSGTEANLLALSLCRAVTGRAGVLVFSGAYHGGILLFAHGISPLNPPYEWVIGEYNDADAAGRLVEEHAHDLAAVIVEPLQGAAGVIPADPTFLQALREATTAHGVLLVFDEVMTARLSRGGMQQLLGIGPDLTTLAKFIGGGLPFGALGGRADLMRRFDPSQPDALQHGGTFNNDVLTMAAGAAGLTQALTDGELLRLNELEIAYVSGSTRSPPKATCRSVPLAMGHSSACTSLPNRFEASGTFRSQTSCAGSSTCTCSNAAFRTDAVGSSRFPFHSTTQTSRASPQRSRSLYGRFDRPPRARRFRTAGVQAANLGREVEHYIETQFRVRALREVGGGSGIGRSLRLSDSLAPAVKVPADAARRFLVARQLLAPARSLDGGPTLCWKSSAAARFSSTR